MDVTSMLNASSVAAQQTPKATENAKIPIRSRTPWDAGGYSLPINTRTTSFTENVQFSDSPARSPRESCHRPSDSHSSMSSFASSVNSGPHSRFSSTSTVGGFYPLSNIMADDGVRGEMCFSKNMRSPLSAVSPLSFAIVRNSSSSPVQPLEALAHIAEEQRLHEVTQNDSTNCSRMGSEIAVRPGVRYESRTKSVPCLEIARPSSPSDAILIKRPSIPAELIIHESQENATTPPTRIMTPKISEQMPGRLSAQTRGHKRAVSAPDFPGVSNEVTQHDLRPPTSVGPIAEPTPPSSQHPDHFSPGASMIYTAPNTPPESTGTVHVEDEVPRCMYIADCDTGSQPRKAVSHIFGRNKTCTRLIPKMVWVYYCRKHYQRTRYRNAKDYVRLQYDLVSQQIKRLREWSDANMRTGQGGIVKDWSIAVRKREQKRLDNRKAKGSFDQDESGDDEPRGPNSAGAATAVPQWLLDQCGRGYSTDKLMEIVNHLGAELMNGIVCVFPDIEILPNIIIDQEEAEEPKGYAKRKATGGHQRSQSLGVSMKSDSQPRSRSLSSQPSVTWRPNAVYNQGPVLQKKRKRYDDSEEEHGDPTAGPQRMRVAEYPVDVGRHGPFGRRPAFPVISEHQGYEGEYVDSVNHEGYYHSSTGTQMSPLPAPTPRRYPSQSMAAQLESYGQNRNSAELRRSIHKRSQSDMGSLYTSQPMYRFSSREEEQHMPQQPQYYDEPPAPRQYYSPAEFNSGSHHMPQQQSLLHGHNRHQSTPHLARNYAPPPEMSPRYNEYRQMTLPPPGHLVLDASPGKMLYSERHR